MSRPKLPWVSFHVLLLPPLKISVTLPSSFRFCVPWISCVDIKCHSWNLNFHLFPSPLYDSPNPLPPSKKTKQTPITKPFTLLVIQKSLTSSFPCCSINLPLYPQSILVYFYLASHQGLWGFSLQCLLPFLSFLILDCHHSSVNSCLTSEAWQQAYLWSTYIPLVLPPVSILPTPTKLNVQNAPLSSFSPTQQWFSHPHDTWCDMP